MPNKYKIFVTMAAVFLFNANASYGRDDWQQFQDINFKYKLNKRFSLCVKPEIRLKHDFGHAYYVAFAQGILYRTYKWVDIEIMYQYSEQENAKKHEFDSENRLYGGPILKWKSGGFDFSDRSRMEYRYIGDKDKWRYRNEFKISHPAQIYNFKFAPFIADEIYYDFKKDGLNLNWLTLGYNYKVNEILGVDIYYRLQSQRRHASWDETNILGSSLKINF